jgi:hypothetical protein
MWEVERMKPARIIVPAGRKAEKASARSVADGRTTIPAAALPPAAALDALPAPGVRRNTCAGLVDMAPCRTTGAAWHAKSGPGGHVDVIRSRTANMPMPA